MLVSLGLIAISRRQYVVAQGRAGDRRRGVGGEWGDGFGWWWFVYAREDYSIRITVCVCAVHDLGREG